MIKNKLMNAAATGAILLYSFATPAFAATTLEISGNGAGSESSAAVSSSQTNTVVQDNTATIHNDVDVHADTGHNDANKNTGGDVRVTTGDSSSTVGVSNTANSNSASVNCCQSGNSSVLISGNGADSKNDVAVSQSQSNTVFQTNSADISNEVETHGNTGYNDANKNTGGDVTVKTGNSDSTVLLNNKANRNVASVGGGTGAANAGSWSARIIGNGADSANAIALDLSHDNVIDQSNDATVSNDVDVNASTGYNDANENTGGDVRLTTGDADITVAADTTVNFNHAELDCGCLFGDLVAKISGNGADSTSDIAATLDDANVAFQTNAADVNNELDDLFAKTGGNDANENTGSVSGSSDPELKTGDSTAEVIVDTTANLNEVGTGSESSGLTHSVDVSFDLSGVLGLWASLFSHH